MDIVSEKDRIISGERKVVGRESKSKFESIKKPEIDKLSAIQENKTRVGVKEHEKNQNG